MRRCEEMENSKLLWSGNNEHENGVGMYLVGGYRMH